MEILARGVGRRKEAVAQVQIVKGTGRFLINNLPAQQYLHNNTCSLISVKAPLLVGQMVEGKKKEDMTGELSSGNFTETTNTMDTIVKVKGGGLVGQAEAIKLGLARAILQLSQQPRAEEFLGVGREDGTAVDSEEIRKNLKDKGYLTQDSRVKERRKYGLKKARKASQYHKR